MLNRLNNLILILLIFILSGCMTLYNPATGKKEALLIDTESEVSLGQDMDIHIQKKRRIISSHHSIHI